MQEGSASVSDEYATLSRIVIWSSLISPAMDRARDERISGESNQSSAHCDAKSQMAQSATTCWLHESRRMQFRLPDLCACIAAALALGLTSVEYNRLFWLFAALGAQLRLRANMLDGMVALVSARASKVGELYNEVPDRVWDAAVFIGQVTPVAEHCAWLHRNDSGVLHCLRSRRGKNRRLA